MFFSVVTKNLIWEILIKNLTGLTGLRMKNLNMEVHCKIRSLGSFHEI